MLIPSSQLPSKGLFTKDKVNIDIYPLTFKQLLDYMETPEVTPIGKLRKDLKVLSSMGVDLNKVSLLDMDYLIFMYKAITIKDNVKFNSSSTCAYCGGAIDFSFKMTDISFQSFDEEDNRIPTQINLSNDEEEKIMMEIRIPTIAEYLKIVEEVLSMSPDIKLAQIRLYSLFAEWETNPMKIVNLINNATRRAAGNLLFLDHACFGRVEPIEFLCGHCGRNTESGIDILGITENFFSDFLRNNGPDESQVLFK